MVYKIPKSRYKKLMWQAAHYEQLQSSLTALVEKWRRVENIDCITTNERERIDCADELEQLVSDN